MAIEKLPVCKRSARVFEHLLLEGEAPGRWLTPERNRTVLNSPRQPRRQGAEDFVDSALDKLQNAHRDLAELALAEATPPETRVRDRLQQILCVLEDSLTILRLTHRR